MMRYAIKKADGGAAIMQTVKDDTDPLDEIAKWHPDTQAKFVVPFAVREISPSEVPSDREFRDAWVDNGAAISVDINKAKTVQRARIDNAKRAKAKDLIERETMGEDVTAEKAQLRAIHAKALTDAAADIASLKATWPSGLSRPSLEHNSRSG